MSFGKLLIANRGEIACRIIRTARRMGYTTVAVFSDADRDAPHVTMADAAVHIGPSSAAESYLCIDRLLNAARLAGADAIHPGYGFLSENAAFARACVEAGITFIGPPAEAIAAMGDKAVAKRRMLAAGVPCAPGYLGEDQTDATLQQEARKLGYPLLVKAVAGGGGRGMRLVRGEAELQPGIEGARREATSAFGDGTLMLERLIEGGRHIEIQVFADAHGHAVHMGERDCTAQRRRQKVIEEAPSPVVSAALREAMGRDAVAAALAVGYRGAGTVEFIVDAQRNHYFLEMNTRLQVEHPVTELVTGFDLVEWQLRVAAGGFLPATQAQIVFRGHAIEARLYVEDPYSGFIPQTGRIAWWRPQRAQEDGARIDDGIREGDVVSPFYDPMVAKVIVYGEDRDDAIRRLRAALLKTPLLGVKNNARFLRDLVDHCDFRQAHMTTTTIDRWLEDGEPLLQAPVASDSVWQLAAMLLAGKDGNSWRADSVSSFGMTLKLGDVARTLQVRTHPGGTVAVTLDGQTQEWQCVSWNDGVARFVWHGVQQTAVALVVDSALHLAWQGDDWQFAEVSAFPGADALQHASRITSPVAGRVSQVLVASGDPVLEGQRLVCVEAMKMEMWQTAQATGTVRTLLVAQGDQVESGALLLELDSGPSNQVE